jgi:DNA polymerase III subunit beta
MKFQASRSDFLEALQRIQGVVERRNTMPILSNVLIQTQKNSVQLFATDLEISMRGGCPASVAQGGRIAVSARKFYEIVKELPDGPVTIGSADKHGATIEAGASRFKIVGLPPEDFPSSPPAEQEFKITVDKDILADLIRKTIVAVGDNDTRYILNGVLIELLVKGRGRLLRFVGTDGHRLAVYDRPLQASKEEGVIPEKSSLIIPKKALVEIKKTLEERDGAARLGFGKGQLTFESDDFTMTARAMEGSYPNYEQVVPKGNDKSATVSRAAFEGALRRMAIVSREKTNAVKLSLGHGKITLASSNPELGEGQEDVQARYTGEALTTGFNARYFLDLFAAMDDAEIAMELKDPLSPCLVRGSGNPDFQCVIMPMRI